MVHFFLRVSIAKTLDESMFKMKVGSPKEVIKNKNQYFQLLLAWARTKVGAPVYLAPDWENK